MTHQSGKTFRSIAAFNPGLLLLALALVTLMFPPSGWSQDDAAEETEDSSEHVEESEEAYRRRMELEEAGDRADVILDRSAGPLKAPEGMDALPYESRKHLRDELRNVIIEQGEWQPEDVNASYPYNPSAAAQKDPELRKQEEEAWGDLIQEYHKRESAALEAGGGRSGTSPGSSSSPANGQAGVGGSQGSSSGAQGSRSPDTRPETAATSSTAAGAGVSQSALEFLKGQSGGQYEGQAGGQSGGRAGASSGGPPAGQSGSSPGMPAGNATASNTQTQSGAQQQAGSASPAGAAAQKDAQQSPDEAQAQLAGAAGTQPESSGKEKEESGNPPPPPGSLAIAELLALEEGQKRKAAEDPQSDPQKAEERTAESAKADKPARSAQQPSKPAEEKQASQTTTDNSSASDTQSVILKNDADQQPPPPPPPPGTIAIPELEKLKGLEGDDPAPVEKPR